MLKNHKMINLQHDIKSHSIDLMKIFLSVDNEYMKLASMKIEEARMWAAKGLVEEDEKLNKN